MSWDQWCQAVGPNAADTWIFQGNERGEVAVWGQVHETSQMPPVQDQDCLLKGLCKDKNSIYASGVMDGNQKYTCVREIDETLVLLPKGEGCATKEAVLVRKCCPYGSDGVFLACRMQKEHHPREVMNTMHSVGAKLAENLGGQQSSK